MKMLKIGWHERRRVLLIGCAIAVLVGCGTTADDPAATPGEAAESQDTAIDPAPVPEVDVSTVQESVAAVDQVTTAASDASKWEEADLGPALGDDFVSLTEHDGEIWIAHPVGENRAEIEVRNLAGDQVHDFGTAGSSMAPLLRSTPFGLLLMTSDYESFLPKSWLSTDDGATWTEGTIADRPFDVSGLTVVGDHLLASGAFRPLADPNSGPFTPGLFRSDDGVTWSEIVLDRTVFDTTDGALWPIVDQGDRLVTTSTRLVDGYFAPAMFESLDGGFTWQLSADAGPVPSGFVTAGRTLVGIDAVSTPEAPLNPVAANSSRTWSSVDVTPFVPPFQYSSAFVLAGGPQALVSLSVEPTVEYCYENTDACGRGYTPVLLLINSDGTAASIDLGLPGAQSANSGFVRADGSLAVVTYNDDRLVLRTWDVADGPVPVRPKLAPFTPTGPPTVQWDSEIQVGETYRYALYTHCGIDFLGKFNDKNWWIVGSPSEAYDPNPRSGSQQILGEMVMIDDDTIEYRFAGDLIATYAPTPEAPPGCA
jgi:hypothetical protein